tara:strand:+ start:3541 stop:4521 length:981 start_codon:yes stop_codon:yes gene_type:complete
MKIAFITASPNAAASEMYWYAMKLMPEITFYDQTMDLRQFDVALVMTYEHQLVKQIKQIAPNIKVAIVDPRSHKVIESAKMCDFLVIDSIEMEDYWRQSRIPIFRYSEYPSFDEVKKVHTKKDKIVIGYHGNQIHLTCMSDTVTPALSRLGQKYNLELMVIYNGSPPTGQEAWYPQNVKVTHVQWGSDKYVIELSKCDIGLTPNKMPFKENPPYAHELQNSVNYAADDYVLRFKMPTNPGRIIVFGKLGIPVISDFYPSAFEILSDGKGFVCRSSEAWEYNLESLIRNHKLRQTSASKLQNYIRNNLNFNFQNTKFLNFLREEIVK